MLCQAYARTARRRDRARRHHPRRHPALRVRLGGGDRRTHRVALDTGVPIGFGLLTCDDEAQALDRAGLPDSREDKGREAVEAALSTWNVLRTLA